MQILSTIMWFEGQETGSLLEEGRFSNQSWYIVNDNLSRSFSDEDKLGILQPPSEDEQPDILPIVPNPIKEEPVQTEISDSEPEPSRRNGVDYQKNICANIAKKIVQNFIASKHKRFIKKICQKNDCSLEQVQAFYAKKMKDVFGLTHLYLLVTPLSEDETEIKMKRVFATYLRWFLREKYIGYMLRFGKMSDREKYIQYKNKYLLYIDEAVPCSFLMD